MRRGCSGWRGGCANKRPVSDSGCRARSATVPSATSLPPRLPAPGPMSMTWSARRIVSSSCFDDERVALVAERLQRREQDLVVARMQADRRLVEHVAHALGCCPAAPRGGCAAPHRRRASARRGPASVAEADFLQELRPARRSRRSRRARCRAARRERGRRLQRRDPAPGVGDRPPGGDGAGAARPSKVTARAAGSAACPWHSTGVSAMPRLHLLGREALLAPPCRRPARIESSSALRCSRGRQRSPVPTQLVHQPCLLL